MLLWLIGMMGSGKTRVGQLAAARREVPFFDTDRRVEEQAGCSIAELWAERGEPAFRRLEAEAVRWVSGLEGIVATGGGVVLDPGNVVTMRATGTVVWLDADASTLARRVGSDRARPLLVAEEPVEERLRRIAAERAGRYATAAHIRIRTDLLGEDAVADEVMELWNAS